LIGLGHQLYAVAFKHRCIDYNSRLSGWNSGRGGGDRASKVHALNLNWNHPEYNGAGLLWSFCAESVSREYIQLCSLIGSKASSNSIPDIEKIGEKFIRIDAVSADSLFHISDKSVDVVVTDPPYYATISIC
jgi:adenine-specific DNA methylase